MSNYENISEVFDYEEDYQRQNDIELTRCEYEALEHNLIAFSGYCDLSEEEDLLWFDALGVIYCKNKQQAKLYFESFLEEQQKPFLEVT